ncbi:unnamed protein product [Cylindrotheca closterium]|uniref:Uncharacterized protein n=1 Tax=Cylindrotheca closterium TaxID=2856 RepID=A0AAD2G604_9STRA|nr:unnamed protein product [Cylindrotheca closterium]
MTFITRTIAVSSLLSVSTAFTASPSIIDRRFKNTPEGPEGMRTTSTRFFADNVAYSYDMGIGKNEPLDTDDATDHTVLPESIVSEDDDIYGAAQFMAQYESTNKFPSPLDDSSSQRHQHHHHQTAEHINTVKAAQTKTNSNKKKSLPKVQFKRQLEDVLYILTDDLSEHATASTASGELDPSTNRNHRPVMMIQESSSNRQLDINSVWVEMLIHHQQNIGAAPVHQKQMA